MKVIRQLSVVSCLCAALFCASALAQTNAPTLPALPALPTNSPASGIFNLALGLLPAWDPTKTNSFGSGEFDLSSSALWKSMSAAGPTPFNSTEADYFFTRNIGAGAELISLGSGQGSSTVDTLNLAFTLRKDVGNIAGYLLLDAGRDFNQAKWEGAVGPGLTYQYSTHLRVFLDTRFEFEGTKSGDTGFLTRFGLAIPF